MACRSPLGVKMRTNEEIAAGWIAFYASGDCAAELRRAPFGDPDAPVWAVDAVMDLEFEDPGRVLEIAFLIARRSDDPWVLSNLGAGPLESLLAEDPTFLDACEAEARISPNLRLALRSVWPMNMTQETFARVLRIAGIDDGGG